jgi:hypothetical protein
MLVGDGAATVNGEAAAIDETVSPVAGRRFSRG